jgi:hypothetical protein
MDDQGERPAAEVFRIDVIGPSRRSRLARLAVTLGLGVLLMGAAPTNAGGRRLAIVERSSGHTLVVWPEPYADEAHQLLGRITADLESVTADEFARAWIEGLGES